MATNLARLRGNDTAEPLQEQFRLIDFKIRATGDGSLPGFILCGPPGWGKSYLVKKTLRAMGIEPMPISIQNEHALIHSLSKHRSERVLLLDDSDQLPSRPSCMNILKGAFGPDREVVWDSREAQKEFGHGLRFKVKSGLIWVSNINYTDPTTRKAGDAHWNAMLSRGIRPNWLDTTNEQDALSYIVHLATNGQMIFSESNPQRFDKPTSETIVRLFIERRDFWKELSPRCMGNIIKIFSSGRAGSELRYALLKELLAPRPVRQLREIPCPKIVGKGVWE
jgi:hypothetical protein